MVTQAISVAVVAIKGSETRAIVIRGVFVVVASLRIGASRNLKRVTNPIAVCIFQANAVTIVAQFWENTLPGDGGVWVVVASVWAQTAYAAFKIAALVINVGVGIVVTGIGVRASFYDVNAGAVVLSGIGIVVQGLRIIATQHLEGITYAVPVEVTQTDSVAIVACLRVVTFSWVNGIGIEVAGCWRQAPHARIKLTRAIVGVRSDVVVAGRIVGTTFHGQYTRSIVFCRFRIEVQGRLVGATGDFKLVAYAVSIGVFKTVAITIVTAFWVVAFPWQIGIWVVVAGGFVQATFDQT